MTVPESMMSPSLVCISIQSASLFSAAAAPPPRQPLPECKYGTAFGFLRCFFEKIAQDQYFVPIPLHCFVSNAT